MFKKTNITIYYKNTAVSDGAYLHGRLNVISALLLLSEMPDLE